MGEPIGRDSVLKAQQSGKAEKVPIQINPVDDECYCRKQSHILG